MTSLNFESLILSDLNLKNNKHQVFEIAPNDRFEKGENHINSDTVFKIKYFSDL